MRRKKHHLMLLNMLLSGSNVKITSVSNSVVTSQPTKGKTLFPLH